MKWCVPFIHFYCSIRLFTTSAGSMQVGMIHNGETTQVYVGDKRKSEVALRSRLRPSKIRAMLAMRACRSSIMVGTVLTYQQMRMIVSRLAELDGPWNCPHGRPTLRHVCSLPASA